VDDEIRDFLEIVHARYGYDLRGYSARSISRRVRAALARSGLPDLQTLGARLAQEPALFATVLDDLTVRVSEMFRDPPFHRALREQVVPLLRTYPLLNIWHCGCATGEEVYSVAILLTETGLYDRAQIYATDLSQRALEQAKEGVYPAHRLATFAENYRQAGGTGDLNEYVTQAYDQIALRSSLRRKVLFFQHDMVSDHVFGEMHLVLCRNVIIYFGPELRGRVFAKLTGSLAPGGFLALGAEERLPSPAVAPTAVGLAEFAPAARIYRQGHGLSAPPQMDKKDEKESEATARSEPGVTPRHVAKLK
jgi:chemotaxis protein methyltransferase CheR